MIWRTALNDYIGRLNLPQVPDQLEALGRLHGHALSTDPDLFVVAERSPGRALEDIVGFASAVRRGQLWFLSMLFIEPAAQGRGLGRRLLERVLPPGNAGPATESNVAEPSVARALVTDSVQPISNGLYARYGIVARMPLVHLAGRPDRPAALPPLPAGVTVRPLPPDELPPEMHRLDKELLGFEHAADHRLAIAAGRRPFGVEAADGAFLGYGYASPIGNIGPVAVRDAALLAPVTAALLGLVEPRGAFAAWVPGAAGETFSSLIRSGFRIDGFPLLLCWSRPFADFTRYLPQSPGLL